MIKKSLLILLVLFILYSLFIFLNPKLGSAQHQWQDNQIKAQRYIYDNSDTIDNVIIGSSLSCHLIMDSLPGFYNLSFNGLSIFDGLKIIKNKNTFPKNVYIETNVILREENADFTSSLLNPILFHLKTHFISLRADNQPVTVFIHLYTVMHYQILNKIQVIKSKLKRKIKKTLGLQNSKSKKPQPVEKKVEGKPAVQKDALFKEVLQMRITNYSKPIDKIELQNRLKSLSEYVKILKENHVNVYFFEMPVNSKLIELSQPKTIRKEIHKQFSVNAISYINSDSTKYHTTDGLHLGDYTEAIKYTLFLKNELNRNY